MNKMWEICCSIVCLISFSTLALAAEGTASTCLDSTWGCGDDWKISFSVPAYSFAKVNKQKYFQALMLAFS